MRVVSTLNIVSLETEKKQQHLVIFKPWILLLCHIIWWEVKLGVIQTRVVDLQFHDGKTVKNTINQNQNREIKADQQWAETKTIRK